MSEIITYKNGPSGKYCQIKLDDGNRILISIAQTGVKVMKLKWGGMIPSGDIFDITTQELFSEEYKHAREKLTEKSIALDMLDVFKEILIECGSLEEAVKTLDDIFRENKQGELNADLKNPDESKVEQLAELSREHPVLMKLASEGTDCDVLPHAKGDFGFVPTNPIPVNGTVGEMKYLARLRCSDLAGLMFHRLETIDIKDIEGSVDIFEAVCTQGKHWSIFCLHMFHPRRSHMSPKGYSFSEYHPTFSKVGAAWGTTQHDKSFPFGLGMFIQARFGTAFANKYEEIVKNKDKFKKPPQHKELVEELLFTVRRVKKGNDRND